MVLDIGGSVGALHVLVDDGWVGRELFLATDDPAFSVHTGVWLRHVAGEHVASALFAALEEGTYRVLGDDGAHRRRRRAWPAAAVAEIDLIGAIGRRCSGRHGAMTVAGGDSSPPRTWQWTSPWCHHSRPVHAHSTASRRSSRCLAARSTSGVGSSSSVAVTGWLTQVDRRVVEQRRPAARSRRRWRPAAPGTRPARGGAACACRSGARGRSRAPARRRGRGTGSTRTGQRPAAGGPPRPSAIAQPSPASRVGQHDAGEHAGQAEVRRVRRHLPAAVAAADLLLALAHPGGVVDDERGVDHGDGVGRSPSAPSTPPSRRRRGSTRRRRCGRRGRRRRGRVSFGGTPGRPWPHARSIPRMRTLSRGRSVATTSA